MAGLGECGFLDKIEFSFGQVIPLALIEFQFEVQEGLLIKPFHFNGKGDHFHEPFQVPHRTIIRTGLSFLLWLKVSNVPFKIHDKAIIYLNKENIIGPEMIEDKRCKVFFCGIVVFHGARSKGLRHVGIVVFYQIQERHALFILPEVPQLGRLGGDQLPFGVQLLVGVEYFGPDVIKIIVQQDQVIMGFPCPDPQNIPIAHWNITFDTDIRVLFVHRDPDIDVQFFGVAPFFPREEENA
jgi:hypothetical protein